MILPVFTDYLFWLTVVLVKVADLTQKLEQRTEWVDILPVPYYRSANLSQENQCSFFLNARSCSLNMTIVAINFPPLLVQISASQRNPPQLSHPYVLGPILLFFPSSLGQLIHFHGFKYLLSFDGSHIYVFSSYLSPSLYTHIAHCSLDIFTWMPQVSYTQHAVN